MYILCEEIWGENGEPTFCPVYDSKLDIDADIVTIFGNAETFMDYFDNELVENYLPEISVRMYKEVKKLETRTEIEGVEEDPNDPLEITFMKAFNAIATKHKCCLRLQYASLAIKTKKGYQCG